MQLLLPPRSAFNGQGEVLAETGVEDAMRRNIRSCLNAFMGVFRRITFAPSSTSDPGTLVDGLALVGTEPINAFLGGMALTTTGNIHPSAEMLLKRILPNVLRYRGLMEISLPSLVFSSSLMAD